MPLPAIIVTLRPLVPSVETAPDVSAAPFRYTITPAARSGLPTRRIYAHTHTLAAERYRRVIRTVGAPEGSARIKVYGRASQDKPGNTARLFELTIKGNET